jgi:hypothetical protein
MQVLEDKLKDLNLRIQASIAFEEQTQESSTQLDEFLNDNKQLKEQNQRLQSLLKVVRDGNVNFMTTARANPSTRGNESSSSIVANYSSSMLPFVNVKELKKRDLSPESKTNNDSFAFKRPKDKPRHSNA